MAPVSIHEELEKFEDRLPALIEQVVSSKFGKWAVGVLIAVMIAAASGASAWQNNTNELQNLKDKGMQRDFEVNKIIKTMNRMDRNMVRLGDKIGVKTETPE